MTTRYWHGGVPDLRIGDLIEPGHKRKAHDGCAFCEARTNGQAIQLDGQIIDPPSEHQDRVYLTADREYARFHASLYGRGDLYRVEPIGDTEPSTEDLFPTIVAPAARIIAIYDRAVLLTPQQRRALNRRWAALEPAQRSA